MSLPEIVSHEEWETARKELLVREKELTRARDELAAARRRLPMVLVEKDYRFEGPEGEAALIDLFEGRHRPGRLGARCHPGVRDVGRRAPCWPLADAAGRRSRS
jgi:hypothetical protein